MNTDNLWNEFLDKIKERITPLSYDTWFKDTKLYKLDGGTATIIVPLALHKKHLEENYIDDIEEITMLDRLPSGIRTNGVGASTYNLGNFSIDGYGKCKLYLYFENPNCISIKLKDGRYIFFNSKSNDETLRYYAELQKLLEK